MGTWGTDIFADDLAVDIRTGWLERLERRVVPHVATQQLLEDFAPALRDPEEAPVFWLALALAQWESSLLVDSVREKALEVIDLGTDLLRWSESPKLHRERTEVLTLTRELLLSKPLAARRRGGGKAPTTTRFAVGDVFRYRASFGSEFVFWAYDVAIQPSGTYVRAQLLDAGVGGIESLPQVITLSAMERRFDQGRNGITVKPRDVGILLVDESDLPPDKLIVVGNASWPPSRSTPNAIIISARDLDRFLEPFRPGADHVIRQRRP